MRYILPSIAAILLSGLASGCDRNKADGVQNNSVSPTGAKANSPELEARLAAAQQISNPTERDQALAKLSLDASASGAAEVVAKAVQGIGNPSVKDDSAAVAAIQLAGVGKPAEATQIASTISNPTLRDKTLSKLAKGEFGG